MTDGNLAQDSSSTRLHLGCGTRYLDGYINIDYPVHEQSVQTQLVADRYEDITQLSFPVGSVDEIRLHHVFEHFPRQIALALLCRWCDWLKPGGVLRIETPDLMGAAWALVSPFVATRVKYQIVRHLFGSHEAKWAAHWDGWCASRFLKTLRDLGFEAIEFKRTRWEALHNIEVTAKRGGRKFSTSDYESAVRRLLELSLITHAEKGHKYAISLSEQAMLEVWMGEWRAAYAGLTAPHLRSHPAG